MCQSFIGVLRNVSKNSPTFLPTIVPNVKGVYGGLKVVVPNSPIFTPAVSAMIPKACIFPSLPWSVPIPVVVYLLTCSIDLKPSLNASFMSFAVASFW